MEFINNLMFWKTERPTTTVSFKKTSKGYVMTLASNLTNGEIVTTDHSVKELVAEKADFTYFRD